MFPTGGERVTCHGLKFTKAPVIWSRVPETGDSPPLRQLYRAFICENVVPVGLVKVLPA